jgi:LPS sulfotransferase NodH
MPKIFLANKFTPYVILFIERDGSTYLSSLLSSHPYIEAVFERFAVMKQKNAGALEQIEWAKEFWTPALINKVIARGFKTKLVDIVDPQGFASLCKEKNVKIIHMHRQNKIKAVISKINAKQLYDKSGFWNLYQEEDRIPATLFDISQVDELILEREKLDCELEDFVSKLGQPTLKVTYENLLLNKEELLKQIFEFLHVSNKLVEAKTMKHTDDDLRNVILNYDELRNHYTNTPYFEMFA